MAITGTACTGLFRHRPTVIPLRGNQHLLTSGIACRDILAGPGSGKMSGSAGQPWPGRRQTPDETPATPANRFSRHTAKGENHADGTAHRNLPGGYSSDAGSSDGDGNRAGQLEPGPVTTAATGTGTGAAGASKITRTRPGPDREADNACGGAADGFADRKARTPTAARQPGFSAHGETVRQPC